MNQTTPDSLEPETVVIVGHARLPQGLSTIDAPVIVVELEVQREDGLIVDLDISGTLPAAKRLLVSLLVGKHMQSDFAPALHDFHRRYLGAPQKAISTALTSAHESYERSVHHADFAPFSPRRFGPP
jgi:hypothetical protein